MMRKNQKLLCEFCDLKGKRGESEMRVLGFEPRTYGLKDRCSTG